jgi:ferredoxin-nitrite reductase
MLNPEPIFCPGLFEPAPSKEGFLLRIRIPGGLVNYSQAIAIGESIHQAGADRLQITNRANLQFSSTQQLSETVLRQIQSVGLAAPMEKLDRLRNIMASPIAGLSGLIDTRPLVRDLDRYLSNQLELTSLSAKFSIGIDGGEGISIRQRPNDLCLVATSEGIRLLLRLEDELLDTNLVWPQEWTVTMVGAIAQWYRERSLLIAIPAHGQRRSRKPRLRQFLTPAGLEDLLRICRATGARASILPLPIVSPATHNHLGIYPQGMLRFYVGVAIPLGELLLSQWQGLVAISKSYGSGTLRLTPWQNVILSDIEQVPATLAALADLGLSASLTDPAGWIVACRGTAGCSNAETASQDHARYLIERSRALLSQPLQIHISGCNKGCAYPLSSDLALLGRDGGYEVYLPEAGRIFGRVLYSWLPANQALEKIEKLLQLYSVSSQSDTFPAFVAQNRIDGAFPPS